MLYMTVCGSETLRPSSPHRLHRLHRINASATQQEISMSPCDEANCAGGYEEKDWAGAIAKTLIGSGRDSILQPIETTFVINQ
jgi:hypothetical protein